MNRLILDALNCAGCCICELACSFHHEGVFAPTLSRINIIKIDKHGFDYPVFCRQCDECPPIEICPVNAIQQTKMNTLKVSTNCTGCGLCVEACKFNAIKITENRTPISCDLCDGSPTCVEACPTTALSFRESLEFKESPNESLHKMLRSWGIDK